MRLELSDATIRTFIDLLMQPKGIPDYAQYVHKLDEVGQAFFATQFDDNEYVKMRKAVERRLFAVMGTPSMLRMIGQTERKLDLFKEMNEGKLILINTSAGLLQKPAFKTFGRFFIAMLNQAVVERSFLSDYEKTHTEVFIDECQEYIDLTIDEMLAQARKQRVGLFLATQYQGQKDMTALRAAIAANTATKFIGSASAADARNVAADMRTNAEMLLSLPPNTFAAYTRGMKAAIPVKFPLADTPRERDLTDVIAYQRATYGASEPVPDQPLHPDPDDPDDLAADPDEKHPLPFPTTGTSLVPTGEDLEVTYDPVGKGATIRPAPALIAPKKHGFIGKMPPLKRLPGVRKQLPKPKRKDDDDKSYEP